ncbi:MAG TPA: FecR domain-containing protein [Puia sp.]
MENIKTLLLKHLKGELTLREQAELDKWLAESGNNRAVLSEISDPELMAGYLDKMDRFDEEGTWEKILTHRNQAVLSTSEPFKNDNHTQAFPERALSFPGKKWLVYAAAAAIFFLFIGGGIIFYWRQSPKPSPIAAKKEVYPGITPGKDQAVLTLADGRKILLDSSSKGTIANQGGTEVVNARGRLKYDKSDENAKSTGSAKGDAIANDVVYNTVETGRGNQYQLVLPDGSKVWLNAASSLHYPTSFTGNQRKVVLTGEGYFSIVKNVKKPFIVSFNNTDVKVLGTEFNVMAYSDEPGGTRTTLISGSVSINSGRQQMKLEPGKIAIVDDESIKIKSNEDIEQVIAWKNGQISLNNADLKMVMRQISRWYDVDVRYEGVVARKHFGGLVDRNVNLSAVLDFLAENGVHTKIKGREITVLK